IARWRRDEAGFFDPVSLVADADLALPKGSGVISISAGSLDDRPLEILEEGHADRFSLDHFYAGLGRPNVVLNLADLCRLPAIFDVLRLKDFGEGSVRTFQRGRAHCLAVDRGLHDQPGVRQLLNLSLQCPKRPV